LNDSVYCHEFYELGKFKKPIKDEDGSIVSDTFKLINNELFVKKNNSYYLLLSTKNFHQKRDTFCDVRTRNWVCYTPGHSYAKGSDSLYFFKKGNYFFNENFGIEFNPQIGITAICEGREVMYLEKFNIN